MDHRNPDQEQLEIPQSYSTEPMSSNDTVIDYQEEDDEPTDFTDYDTKLEPISITKIDTKRFLRNDVILDINDLRSATELIQRIRTEGEQKQNKDSLGPNNERPKLDNEATVNCASTSSNQNTEYGVEHDQEKEENLTPQSQSQLESSDVGIQDDLISNQSSNSWTELELNRHVSQMMEEKGKHYKLKLFLDETKQDSQFSKLFKKIVTEKGRERLCREKEVCKSYILFLYRNVPVEQNDFRAEIYALTTGSKWQDVSEYADKDFSKSVEKRTLKFPFQHVEYKRDIGPVHKETKTARTGHEITFSTWDYLGILIGNRTRSIRDNSSLFAKDVDAFLAQNGKQIPSNIKVREKSMKIHRKLSISQLGRVLDHFSKICSHGKTYLDDGSGAHEETDEPMFEMLDCMAEVTDNQTFQKLNESLHKTLEQSMDGKDSYIFLIHEEFDKWSTAEEISLYARTNPSENIIVSDSQKTTRPKRKKRKTWLNHPSLDEVMACLRKKVDTRFRPEWLTDVNIKFGTRMAPLKEFIFSRFSADEIDTYIYNHGKWIEIKAHYLYHIERDFVEEMKTHVMEQNELPQLLPWKHLGKESKRVSKIKGNEVSKMRPKWKKHFETVCDNAKFDKVLVKLDSLFDGSSDLTSNFEELEKMSLEERTAHLYLLLERKLDEDEFNAAHTLFNMILPDDCETKVITCTKKTLDGIELCDILIYNDTTTYLVHVKAGFYGGPIREVCSQIRNAADNIFREHTISKGTGIIDKYWDVLTKEADNSKTHDNVVKSQLENIKKEQFKALFYPSREIVFVLACRDTRKKPDITREIPRSLEVPLLEKMNKSLTPQIIDDLKKNGYITEKGELTNKFILENKETSVQAFRCMESIKTIKKATEVHDVLVSELPKSKSTIAKMEIIRLAHDFERYSIHKKNIQLKLYNVEADFPDVN